MARTSPAKPIGGRVGGKKLPATKKGKSFIQFFGG